MAGSMQRADAAVLQKMVTEVVCHILETMYNVKPTTMPTVKSNHIKWNEKYRMLARGKDKGYYDGSLVASSNYFLSEKHRNKGMTCGAVILYMDAYYLKDFFQTLGMPPEELSNETTVKDFCSEFCNMISSGLTNNLGKAGYDDILKSVPLVARNEIADGIAFNRDNTEYLEFVFFLWNKNVFTIDLTLSELKLKE